MNVYRKGRQQEEAAPSSGVVRFCDSTVFNIVDNMELLCKYSNRPHSKYNTIIFKFKVVFRTK